jgi:L,D-peptidoglycan transpeptidase YkuD (ErfK/YbiS/YcfS/YnhG family)
MRTFRRMLLVGILVVAATVVFSPAAGAVFGPVQVITVKAATSTSQTAVLEAWQRPIWSPVYRRVYGPITANVGYSGVGATREGLGRTPAGTFGLTEAFGIGANPGTALPYRVVDNNDWWVSDTQSPYYNQHYRCAPGSCPFDESRSEHLIDFGILYKHAVVINYNRFPVVPGAGSAFFLHISSGGPTAGCVAVPETHLRWLMQWMKPGYRPAIGINVGSLAYGLVRYRRTG